MAGTTVQVQITVPYDLVQQWPEPAALRALLQQWHVWPEGAQHEAWRLDPVMRGFVVELQVSILELRRTPV